MSADVHRVDHDTFCKCIKGKKLGDRWYKYVDNEELREKLKKEFHRSKQIVLQSELTDGMVFLRQNSL